MEGSRPETRPTLPWKTRVYLAAVSSLLHMARRSDGSVNRRLLSFLDLREPPNPVPVAGVSTSDHVVDPARGLSVRLFSPADAAGPLPVIVYFHGGGFAFFSVSSRPYDSLCRRIASAVPAVVVSVEYRLAPEHRFPAAYDDAYDSLRWVVDGAGGLLPDAPAVFLAGDSAGGNIAHHTARRAAAERVGITGVALLQPFFGGEARTESEVMFGGGPLITLGLTDWLWRTFLPDGADRDHEAANVVRSGSGQVRAGELAGLPATAVFVGRFDLLRDQQMRYVEWLRRAGVAVRLKMYPTIHWFYVLTELTEAEELMTELKNFVWAQLGKASDDSPRLEDDS